MSLAICRTCLSGNYKVYTIRNTPLQEIYQKLTNNELISEDGRPETVCYLCYTQMERWKQIGTRSRQSDNILAQLSHNNIKITQDITTILNKRIQKVFISTPVELTTCLKVDLNHRPLPLLENTTNSHAVVKIEKSDIVEKSEDPKVIEDVAICRSCLGAAITAHSIENTPLQAIYEKLTNAKLVTGDGRPAAVCYICRWLMMKCHKFIIKANKCEKILTELFVNGIQLTENTIEVLNKRMKTSLAVTPIKLFTYVDVTDVKVKEEITESDGDNDAEEDVSPKLKDIISNEHSKASSVKIWHCDECSYRCSAEIQLNKHKRFHDPERRYSCKKCHYRFDTDNHLKCHQKVVHTPTYKCDKCPKKLPNLRELKMHKVTHTNNFFTCEVCAKVFANRSGLRSHNNKNHPNAKHPCGKCNVVFATSQHLREHELKIHTGHLICICDICGNTLKTKSCMRKHMKFVHTERDKLECDECGKKTPNKMTMIAHLGSHRLIKQLKCNLCSRLFNTSSSLSTHKKNHNKFFCKMCGSAFKFKLDLLTHVKIHQLACDICHEFTDDLEKHKFMHKGGEFVKCKFCDRKMSRSNLNNHLKTHTGEKPHSCDVCQKRFILRRALKIHMAIHTGEKKLSCDICDKTFIQSGQLQNHLRAHAGVKLFVCTHCGKKFSEKRSLQCHINIAHAKKIKLICDMCHKVYTNKEQLIKHLKSHKGKKHHYACPVCKKAFQNLILMCHHTKTHKNVKWPCTMCDKNANDMLSINRHYHIAHGVHAYACNICEQGTNDVSALLSHMRHLHNVLSYRCQTCGNIFSEGRKLLEHMRKVHDLRPKRPYIQYYSMRRT